jgi:hypothetical protein
MKKIVLFVLIFSSYQLSAQSIWSSSNKIVNTPFGAIDSIDFSNFFRLEFNNYSPGPINDSFYTQEMKINFMVQGDSLYLVDTGKLTSIPTQFFTKQISNDSIHIALDTIPEYSDPDAYGDEKNLLMIPNGTLNPPFNFQSFETKLNLGHISNTTNNYFRYKSIWYHITSTSANSVQYYPNWTSSNLLEDTTISITNTQFTIRIENDKIVFYHAANAPYNIYNLNKTALNNDSLYIELYPSRNYFYNIPLAKKTRNIQWYSPRFEVASCNEFTDTLSVGYYYERIAYERKQFFDWVTIIKDTVNNTISYSPSILSGNLTFALPISELQLQVKNTVNSNEVNWTTIGEENVEYFEVEKSTSGTNFSSIYTTPAVGGVNQTNYSFIDKDINEINYYRIKAVDKDGQKSYSNTVIIKNAKEYQEISISPNPTNGIVNITGIEKEDYKYKVSTLDGRILIKDNFLVPGGDAQLDISSLVRGMYIISLYNLDSGVITSKKIMKD